MVFDVKVDLNTSIANTGTILDWISIVTTLAVNTMATLLIVYRAWYSSITYTQVVGAHNKIRIHHKSVRGISRNRKTQVEGILLLFIESGALFAAIQVSQFLLIFQKNC